MTDARDKEMDMYDVRDVVKQNRYFNQFTVGNTNIK